MTKYCKIVIPKTSHWFRELHVKACYVKIIDDRIIQSIDQYEDGKTEEDSYDKGLNIKDLHHSLKLIEITEEEFFINAI